MHTLWNTVRRAIVSGSVAGGASASIAAARAKGDGCTPYAPINAIEKIYSRFLQLQTVAV